jgi:DNA-directed RNA polymerase subunit RPC12/RpoP
MKTNKYPSDVVTSCSVCGSTMLLDDQNTFRCLHCGHTVDVDQVPYTDLDRVCLCGQRVWLGHCGSGPVVCADCAY